MPLRYLAASFLTLALAVSSPAMRVPHRGHVRPHPAASAVPASELYSRRALRRARTILELKLLELRRERLERVRRALEHHEPIRDLLNIP